MKKILIIGLLISFYTINSADHREGPVAKRARSLPSQSYSSGSSEKRKSFALVSPQSPLFQRVKDEDGPQKLYFHFIDQCCLGTNAVSSDDDCSSGSIESLNPVCVEVDQEIQSEVVFKAEQEGGKTFMLALAQMSDGQKEKNVLIIPVNSDSCSKQIKNNDFLPGNYDSHEILKEGKYEGLVRVKMLMRIDPMLLERFVTFNLKGAIVEDALGERIPYNPEPQKILKTANFESV
jgi:hypothetical protein